MYLQPIYHDSNHHHGAWILCILEIEDDGFMIPRRGKLCPWQGVNADSTKAATITAADTPAASNYSI